ncbi:hypothetical protein AgCh_024148 [Apium graveolens]
MKLRVVIGIFVGAIIVLILFLLSLCITSRRRRKMPAEKLEKPVESKEIVHEDHHHQGQLVLEIQITLEKQEHKVTMFSDRQSSGESRATNGNDTTTYGGSGSYVGCV